MTVVWLRKALRNLRDEAEFIARDNPAAARDWVRRIETAVQHLAAHPSLGREGRVPGTRERVVPDTRYVVPYRVTDGSVVVLRVFHTSRRLPAKW